MTLHMLQLTSDVPRLIRSAKAQRLLATRQEDHLGYALRASLAPPSIPWRPLRCRCSGKDDLTQHNYWPIPPIPRRLARADADLRQTRNPRTHRAYRNGRQAEVRSV